MVRRLGFHRLTFAKAKVRAVVSLGFCQLIELLCCCYLARAASENCFLSIRGLNTKGCV